MKKRSCRSIEALFAARYDASLNARDETDFDRHLAACSGCRAEFDEYVAAVDALRGIEPAETSSSLRESILAAVDRLDRDGDEPIAANETERVTPRWLGSHLLAVCIGAAAAALVAWLFWPTPRPNVVQQIVTVPVEHRIEVPVDRIVRVEVPVERRVEVTVERIVEVPVEVPIEVPVEVFVEVPVDRPVPRGPLLQIDTAPLAAAITDLVRSWPRPAHDATVAHATPSPRPRTPQPRTSTPKAQPSTVVVERSASRISVQTHGTIHEVVPVLLANLSDEDPKLVAVIERQLTLIHERAADDPQIAERLERAPDADRLEASAAWNSWWQANSSLLAQSESRR